MSAAGDLLRAVADAVAHPSGGPLCRFTVTVADLGRHLGVTLDDAVEALCCLSTVTGRTDLDGWAADHAVPVADVLRALADAGRMADQHTAPASRDGRPVSRFGRELGEPAATGEPAEVAVEGRPLPMLDGAPAEAAALVERVAALEVAVLELAARTDEQASATAGVLERLARSLVATTERLGRLEGGLAELEGLAGARAADELEAWLRDREDGR